MKEVIKKINKIVKLYKLWESTMAVLKANLKYAEKNNLDIEKDQLISNLRRKVTTLERELKELVK